MFGIGGEGIDFDNTKKTKKSEEKIYYNQNMFQNIQKNILDIISLNEFCWKKLLVLLPTSLPSTSSQLNATQQSISFSSSYYHLKQDESDMKERENLYFMMENLRNKLQEMVTHTKLLCDTNIHCLAKITSLQQEKADLIRFYEDKVTVS